MLQKLIMRNILFLLTLGVGAAVMSNKGIAADAAPPATTPAPATTPTAPADSVDSNSIERFKKPMPEMETIPQDKFEEATTLYESTPYGDASLAYRIRIPKEWQKGEEKSSSNFQLNTKLFSDINVFNSPPRMGGSSRLEIKAVDLEYQLTAEQWFLQYILESGMTTESFVVHDEKKAEALMITMQEDTTYFTRILVQINGRRVIMVSNHVPLAFWNDEKSMQAATLASFQILNPKEEQIEKMISYQFLDVAEVKYPESWQYHAKALKSVERMNVKLLNIRQTKEKFGMKESTEGQIDVTLVSAETSDSLIAEIENYKKYLEGTGMLVAKKIGNKEDIKYHENVNFALTEIYQGIDSTNDTMDYEMWFTVMVSGNYYYFITLLTPGRNESYYTWARNTQSYKLVVAQTIPSAGGFLDKADEL